ncbi:MAG: peptidase [Firmicutes bacterium HGW-Firmicutes-16]|nr:MAG: peptidase [Firmicutes bacterium HGW-Firmicutes-16]
MFFDMTYLYLVLPAVILAIWASARVKSTFKKYDRQFSASHITGAQAAQRVLYANGLTNVRVERIEGNLTDNYDPRDNVIRLSRPVYDSTSTAAIGVACHEAGHALQYAQGYAPIKLRAFIIPATNIGSKLAMPLIIIGLIMSYYASSLITVAYAGIIFFAVCVFFQIVTLPVEFNASHRALVAIEGQGMLTEDELAGSRKVLNAAAMTYVAALAVSIAQLLRFLMLVSNRRS